MKDKVVFAVRNPSFRLYASWSAKASFKVVVSTPRIETPNVNNSKAPSFVGPKNLDEKVALNSKDVHKLVSRRNAPDKGRSPSAKNVFVHQKYKSGLRQVMNKPDVENRELREVMDFLYREGATVGSGSTADAIRYERKTGQPVGNRGHSNKGRESIKRLEKWLKNNPNASGSDREVAEHVILDLKDSLGE